MKVIKYLLLTLCLASLSSFSVNAMTVKDGDTEEYLLNHGHSKEIVRMINLQEKRLSSEDIEIKKSNKFVKFWKNIIHERDVTIPLNDFGYNQITTPEAP